jgi:hypothetical protein
MLGNKKEQTCTTKNTKTKTLLKTRKKAITPNVMAFFFESALSNYLNQVA